MKISNSCSATELSHFFDTPEKRRHLLSQISGVGERKPFGFLTTDMIQAMGEDPDRLSVSALFSPQLRTAFLYFSEGVLFGGEEARPDRHLGTEILAVWHEGAMQSLIARHEPAIRRAGWPTLPSEFISYMMHKRVREQSSLWEIVAEAFADTLSLRRNHGEISTVYAAFVRDGWVVQFPDGRQGQVLSVHSEPRGTSVALELSPLNGGIHYVEEIDYGMLLGASAGDPRASL